MRTVVKLMIVALRLLTDFNRPAWNFTCNFHVKRMAIYIPCTSSNAGLLSLLIENGFSFITVHVMFVALSVEATLTLSIDMRRPCTSSTSNGTSVKKYFSPLDSSVPLAFQKKVFPIPVQLNSASPLSEILIDFGGMVISRIKIAYILLSCIKETNLLLLLLCQLNRHFEQAIASR